MMLPKTDTSNLQGFNVPEGLFIPIQKPMHVFCECSSLMSHYQIVER